MLKDGFDAIKFFLKEDSRNKIIVLLTSCLLLLSFYTYNIVEENSKNYSTKTRELIDFYNNKEQLTRIKYNEQLDSLARNNNTIIIKEAEKCEHLINDLIENKLNVIYNKYITLYKKTKLLENKIKEDV